MDVTNTRSRAKSIAKGSSSSSSSESTKNASPLTILHLKLPRLGDQDIKTYTA